VHSIIRRKIQYNDLTNCVSILCGDPVSCGNGLSRMSLYILRILLGSSLGSETTVESKIINAFLGFSEILWTETLAL
jgi:hypothetical protein